MTTRTHKTVSASLLLVAALLACAAGRAATPDATQQRAGSRDARVARGSLAEVTGRRLVALLVSKALVVDARDPALVALEDYRRALSGTPPRQHGAGARLIATRLNKYIRKYRMMSAADDYAEANLFIIFKVTAQRPSAIPGEPFVWGKMYVIAVGDDHAARVVWESEGDRTPPEDATDDFLKAFKAARGEK
jgi:hypothetical protein